MSEGIKKASNECRRTPRWKVVAYYRTVTGVVDVPHDLMELEDLQDVVEHGPDWRALEKIEVFYRHDGTGPLTIEEAKRL